MENRVFISLAILLTIGGYFFLTQDQIDPSRYPKTKSHAFSTSVPTRLGDSLQSRLKKHPGESGFILLASGDQSLQMRLAVIQEAERSIDLQYYAIHDDISANLLIEALLRAAERGVRVRFLIDNISLKDVDQRLATMSKRKNIQIRVFNVPTTKDQSVITRAISYITDFDRLTQRMHNKALIVDNQISIVGGRNLGDEYFNKKKNTMFKDLDLLACGPITQKISSSFDMYWNSDHSYPIAALKDIEVDRNSFKETRDFLKKRWDEKLSSSKGSQILQWKFSEKAGRLPFIWANADIAVDPPQKVESPITISKPLEKLAKLLANATSEFIAVSPYFVPQENGVKALSGLKQKGLHIEILTNSLASTDVVAVHAGYKRYRKPLLEKGIELYEFKPVNNERPKQRLFGSTAPARASLHSKLYIIDKRHVLIGSFNFDPRSIRLNTEILIAIDSPQLAKQARQLVHQAIQPENSYRLTLANTKGEQSMLWSTIENDKPIVFKRDPKPGFWRSIQADIFNFLPLENQL